MSQRTPQTVFHPSSAHWSMVGYKERARRKDYQALLLAGPVFRNGALCDWKGKHLGAGIYDVWLEDRA
jgi:hypothetical protein